MRVAVLLALLALGSRGAEPAQRIASFSPAATRILVDLGTSDRIVAATRWCELPAGHGAARICDAFEPELESLRASGAKLVVIPRLADPRLAARIESIGLRAVVLSAESTDSPAKDIALLAETTGCTAAGERLLRSREQTRHHNTAKRVLIIWDGSCAGPGSYLAWVIQAAGGEVALGDGAWPQWDIELGARARPDLVLVLRQEGPAEAAIDNGTLDRWRGTPGLRTTPAAQTGCIYHVKSGSDWLPASGLPRAAESLARLIRK